MQPNGHAAPGDPYRMREEVQRAHDLLRCVLETDDLRETLLDVEGLKFAMASTDVLCWALYHDHNTTFKYNLAALERCMRNMGYQMHRMDEMEYPDPAFKPKGAPEIERMADELAAARMEIADLNQIIEDMKKEKREEHA